MNIESKIKTIFMGTADFAIPSFYKLLDDERFEVIAVFTQPDKPVGRSGKPRETPIKKIATKKNIPVFQPEKIKDFSSYSKDNSFPFKEVDIIIVVSYAQIIPKTILDIPKYGCINVHGSLLPKYRGSACIQAGILNGDEISGATIMKMDIGMDTGDILSQTKIKIENKETTESLFEKIANSGAEILTDSVYGYISGDISPVKQNDSEASLVKKISKNDGKIDWNKDVEYIEKHIRAMTSWPSAWSKIDGKIIKILEGDVFTIDFKEKSSGQIFQDNKMLLVKCEKGTLKINKIQIEGKKPMSFEVFLNGHKSILDKILE